MSSAYPKHMRSYTVNVLRSLPMTRLHNKGDSTLPCDQPVVVFTYTMLPSTKVPSLSCYQKVVHLDDVLPTPMYSKASLMASRKVFQKLPPCLWRYVSPLIILQRFWDEIHQLHKSGLHRSARSVCLLTGMQRHPLKNFCSNVVVYSSSVWMVSLLNK